MKMIVHSLPPWLTTMTWAAEVDDPIWAALRGKPYRTLDRALGKRGVACGGLPDSAPAPPAALPATEPLTLGALALEIFQACQSAALPSGVSRVGPVAQRLRFGVQKGCVLPRPAHPSV